MIGVGVSFDLALLTPDAVRVTRRGSRACAHVREAPDARV
jgi:hypothetical protein